ncbi:MAG: hypothetical protein AAF420_03800 [Pseudomonadota bacterium]
MFERAQDLCPKVPGDSTAPYRPHISLLYTDPANCGGKLDIAIPNQMYSTVSINRIGLFNTAGDIPTWHRLQEYELE